MEKNDITYIQNPNIDFLFGYFGNMYVPTKQDTFQPTNDIIQIDENGIETILRGFFVKRPNSISVQTFQKHMHLIIKKIFNEENRIKMPSDVQVSLSISIKKERYHEVDVDNLAKTVLDSLKSIAFDDDCQVSSLIVDKHIHPMNVDGILIGITEITNERKGLKVNW